MTHPLLTPKSQTRRRGAALRQRALPVVDLGMVLRLGGLILLAAFLAGCSGEGSGREVVTFGGQQFKGSAKATKEDRAAFVATVRQPAKSIEGAVQAAEYEGTKYCIHAYGTSDIDWTIGPDMPRDQLVITSDALTLTGRCREY